jgi:hypothetical protein
MLLRKLCIVATSSALAATVVAFTVSPASAARYVKGCFSYNGYYYQGVAINLEYKTVSGAWRFLPNTASSTLAEGCQSYTITGTWRRFYIRMKATAWTADYGGFFLGVSRYAGPNNHRWSLGVNALRLYTLPPQALPAPAPPASGTLDEWTAGVGNWVNEITGPRTPAMCAQSAAMQVACYMDSHGLQGNVVYTTGDVDEDGYYGLDDHYPSFANKH